MEKRAEGWEQTIALLREHPPLRNLFRRIIANSEELADEGGILPDRRKVVQFVRKQPEIMEYLEALYGQAADS